MSEKVPLQKEDFIVKSLHLMFHAPYISITDFTTSKEARLMLSIFEQTGYCHRKLGIGVMMSRKTLRDIPSKWTDIFPKKEHVSAIFQGHPLAFNTLHYADYSGQTTRADLENAIGFGGPHLHAIQLDMPWPDPKMVQMACASHNETGFLSVILQIGETAFKEEKDSPTAIVNRLSEYHKRCILQYVLLDRSMGRGRLMDASTMMPYINAIRKAYPDVFVVVAGGLGPDTIGLIRPIVKKHPKEISIDAQGRLRPSHDASNPIDWTMAEAYLRNAIRLFLEEESS